MSVVQKPTFLYCDCHAENWLIYDYWTVLKPIFLAWDPHWLSISDYVVWYFIFCTEKCHIPLQILWHTYSWSTLVSNSTAAALLTMHSLFIIHWLALMRGFHFSWVEVTWSRTKTPQSTCITLLNNWYEFRLVPEGFIKS